VWCNIVAEKTLTKKETMQENCCQFKHPQKQQRNWDLAERWDWTSDIENVQCNCRSGNTDADVQ